MRFSNLFFTQNATNDQFNLITGIITAGALFIGVTSAFGVAFLIAQDRFYGAFALCVFALSASAVGGLVGFLFGIPRSPQRRSAAAVAERPEQDSPQGAVTESGRPPAMSSNTNLEEVSDWLTKILVGVGLTQATAFHDQFGSLTQTLAQGFSDKEQAVPLIGAVLILFFITGFMMGYLLTYLILSREFAKVNQELALGKIDQVFGLFGELGQISEDADSADEEELALREKRVEAIYEEAGQLAQSLPLSDRLTIQKRFSSSFLQRKAAPISEIKQTLRNLKQYNGPIDDGFDEQLVTAIKGFQKQEGLPVDGMIGPQTFGRLARLLPQEFQIASLKNHTRGFLRRKGVQVSEIKEKLQNLALYSGPIDEDFDDQLVEAIRAFQEREHLPADGILGPQTYERLGGNLEGGASADSV